MKCNDNSCEANSEFSLVWPGQGRKEYCRNHYKYALKILNTLGFSAESLDIQQVEAIKELSDEDEYDESEELSE